MAFEEPPSRTRRRVPDVDEPGPDVARLDPASEKVRRFFVRKRPHPPGIAWFGFRSLWGHLRHFAASAIATDGIDSRDWMVPDTPDELCHRIALRLGADDPDAPTLIEALDRDLWIDYMADSGEHAGVTAAVAAMMAKPYALPTEEGDEILGPRGEILIVGGDTAYPVATAQEIHDRFVVPFNRALIKHAEMDQERRVLLGIPGNHDWYDGLDGFSRLFRRKRYAEDHMEPGTEKTRDSAVIGALDFVGKFVAGGQADKHPALVLLRYRAVQSASFWVLPLTPKIHLYAVDRQLKELDYQQKRFFGDHRLAHQGVAPFVLLPDPIHAFGRPTASGTHMKNALNLRLKKENAFVLSGDIHHYRRETIDGSLHVTAGGGGAFLHPAPIWRGGINEAQCEWPTAQQSLSLLRRVPFWVMAGRAGTIFHAAMALVFVPALGLGGMFAGHEGLVPASVVAGILSAIAYAFIGGIRHGRMWQKSLLAALAGLATGFVPTVTIWVMEALQRYAGFEPSAAIGGVMALATALAFGGLTLGAYLAALTRFGFEQTQAFTALAHPGFKHFVRLRVHRSGDRIDAWVIGLTDPLADEPPVLVDRFRWEPKKS